MTRQCRSPERTASLHASALSKSPEQRRVDVRNAISLIQLAIRDMVSIPLTYCAKERGLITAARDGYISRPPNRRP